MKTRPLGTRFFQNCLGVFQGGGCRASAFAGAYEVAIDRGVHFSELAGTSAGSIVAVLIAAGASPAYLKNALKELSFPKLLLPGKGGMLQSIPKVGDYVAMYRDLGIYSSKALERWIEDRLVELLPLARRRPTEFKELQIPTWVVAADLTTQAPKVWYSERDGADQIAKAVCASCSIPFFFQPAEDKYVDGGIISNLPTFVFARRHGTDRPMASRVLAFVLRADESNVSTNVRERLANTIVDANSSVQLDLQEEVSILEIPTGRIKATDFLTITKKDVDGLIANGENAATGFFDAELSHVRSPRPPTTICYGREELLAAITLYADRCSEVLISEFDTEFVYDLFPTVFQWRFRNIPITVLVPKAITKKLDHAKYQRRLLTEMGVRVVEVEAVPLRAYLYNAATPNQAIAFVDVPSDGATKSIDAIKYEGPLDAAAIEAIADKLLPHCGGPAPSGFMPTIVRGGADILLSRLRGVPQYQAQTVEMQLEDVPLSALRSMATSVREYKYRQIQGLVDLYRKHSIKLFEEAVITLSNEKQSIVTPIIVEQTGSNYVVIKGTTRAIYCRDIGEQTVRCVVIRNVSIPLPAPEHVILEKVRIVGRTLEPRDRYAGKVLEMSTYRPVERNVHVTTGP